MIATAAWNYLTTYKLFATLRYRLSGRVVYKPTTLPSRGRALVSYITLPFITRAHVSNGHTNRWECQEIVRLLNERGYDVDIIDWDNHVFLPRHHYDLFFDIHQNMERLAPLLGENCLKILHATTSEWHFQNEAERKRLEALAGRRGRTLAPRRQLSPSRGLDYADAISLIGNVTTAATYGSQATRITTIPVSTTHEYPPPTDKDFSQARSRFIWFGGSGMVHKGLDLVLEAFSNLPELELTVCGKVASEADFADLYKRELYQTPNIKLKGLIDPGSQEFSQICSTSAFLIYPSASEGQSGAVVTMLHAGIIPLCTPQSGVTIDDFGFYINDPDLESIKRLARQVATLPPTEIANKSKRAWEYARTHHSRQIFSREYSKFLDSVISSKLTA